MTTEQAQILKRQLEATLRNEISEFHRKTGFSVSALNMTRHEAREAMRDEVVATHYDVRVTVEL